MSDWRDWINTVQCMDCLEGMKQMPDGCMHDIVTDPPYGLKFMGKEWDRGVPGVPFWLEALRVGMQGAYLLAFGGTRTFHRLMCAIEDAGWEIRDTIMWVYGSGFPKSHDVSKAIDKAAEVEPKIVGQAKRAGKESGTYGAMAGDNILTIPATESAKHWQGWGTALKPAWEPIIVARKPLEGTVAENVLKYGTGAMNIDGCRVGTNGDTSNKRTCTRVMGVGIPQSARAIQKGFDYHSQGRWPANLIHDGSEEVVKGFPCKAGAFAPVRRGHNGKSRGIYGDYAQKGDNGASFRGDSGSAARFFYCAKASKAERGKDNKHPTVKPLKLMEYLVKLISRDDQIILDMFAGSGSTLVACKKLGRRFVGFEINKEDVQTCNGKLKRTQRLAQEVLGLDAIPKK